MRVDKDELLLYAITDRTWLNGDTLYNAVEKALKGGATMIQLREKELSYSEVLEEAIGLNELCKAYNVPLIINDNVDIALESGAAGVHIGQEDGNIRAIRERAGDKLIIGATAHNVEEAVKAYNDGADYLGSGAVFGSVTKKNAVPMSKATLIAITESVPIPVVAIGGITYDNMGVLSGTGIAGMALVSAVFAESDIEKACHSLRERITKVVGNN